VLLEWAQLLYIAFSGSVPVDPFDCATDRTLSLRTAYDRLGQHVCSLGEMPF
jgi:hypothetical protein